ncbi:MAG: hypothetical protein J6U54_11350 [Clostridiales bacterium]|nr:hypothetical protein [Clostridiales bacterium]
MKKGIIGGLIFVVGVAAGSVPTFFLTKKIFKEKYEKEKDEEIQAVREFYADYNTEKKEEKEEPVEEPHDIFHNPELKAVAEQLSKKAKASKEEAQKILAEEGYSEEKLDPVLHPIEPPTAERRKIEVISPGEWKENEDYSVVCLTYYDDRVLADDGDEIIDDPDEVVGEEALGSFGEYDDNVVLVRNDILKTYFEITLDPRSYDEIPRPGHPGRR